MPASLLNRGAASAQAIAAAGNLDFLVECGGNSTLVLEVDMSGAANGDLAVQVNPVADDGEVFPLSQPAVQSIGPSLSGGRVYFWGQYDISAQQRVRVRITNNNAGGQSADYSWRAS